MIYNFHDCVQSFIWSKIIDSAFEAPLHHIFFEFWNNPYYC